MVLFNLLDGGIVIYFFMEVNNLNGDNNCNVGIMILNGGIILGLRL
jgi:hypothetical protein